MRLFGTDGIRGKVNEYPLTAESVLKLEHKNFAKVIETYLSNG